MEKLKSLFSNLEGLPPDRIVPTVGLNIGRIEVSNSKLVFWDLGGQVCKILAENYVSENICIGGSLCRQGIECLHLVSCIKTFMARC